MKHDLTKLKKTCSKHVKPVTSCAGQTNQAYYEWSGFYTLLSTYFSEEGYVDVSEICYRFFKIHDYKKYLPLNATEEQVNNLMYKIRDDFKAAYKIHGEAMFSD